MIGMIGIEDLKLTCKIGVDAHERAQTQDLFVDIQVETDLTKAVEQDHLTDCVDYQAMADAMEAFVTGKEFHLIEKLASQLIDLLFEKFPVSWVWIKLKKPQAISLASRVTVELERFRDEDAL